MIATENILPQVSYRNRPHEEKEILKGKVITSEMTTMELWYNIVGWFLAAVAVVGNGLVIFLITTKQRLHTTANWYIFSLTVADFSAGIVFFPYYVVCDIKEVCSNDEAKFLHSFSIFSFMASTFNLCAMTAERYIAIVKPLKYTNLMSTTRVFIVIAAVTWTLAFLSTTWSVILYMTENKSTPAHIFQGFGVFVMLLTAWCWSSQQDT